MKTDLSIDWPILETRCEFCGDKIAIVRDPRGGVVLACADDAALALRQGARLYRGDRFRSHECHASGISKQKRISGDRTDATNDRLRSRRA